MMKFDDCNKVCCAGLRELINSIAAVLDEDEDEDEDVDVVPVGAALVTALPIAFACAAFRAAVCCMSLRLFADATGDVKVDGEDAEDMLKNVENT